jgi:hypothetical protein
MLTISDRSRRKKKKSPASLRISAPTRNGSSILLSSRLYSEITD